MSQVFASTLLEYSMHRFPIEDINYNLIAILTTYFMLECLMDLWDKLKDTENH